MKLRFPTAFLPVFIMTAVGVLSAVVFSHSALLRNDISQMHIDSQVYIFAGKQILKGKILYRDIFDHKGPVMYVFECLGLSLSGKNFTGLWITQLLFFIAGISPLFIYWAKKYNLLSSIVALVMMMSWIFRTKTIGDNIPEVVAVPIICLFFFLCLKIKDCAPPQRLLMLMAGICGTSLFLLKPNLIIVIIPCALWVCTVLFRQKSLGSFLAFAFAGCAITFIPFVIYFAYHHALGEAAYAFWTFNFSYITVQQLSVAASVQEVFFQPLNYLFVFIIVASALKFFLYKKEKAIFIMLISSLILSVFVIIGISGRGAESVHYAIPLAPLLAWFFIYIAQDFNKFQVAILCGIALFFFKPVMMHLYRDDVPQVNAGQSVHYINEHKEPGETLCVMGNYSSLYWQTDLNCNTPYFFTYPIMHHCNSILTQQFLAAFKQQKASWIVYQTQYPRDSCMSAILIDYKLMLSTKGEQIFQLK